MNDLKIEEQTCMTCMTLRNLLATAERERDEARKRYYVEAQTRLAAESKCARLRAELERSRYKGCGSYPRAIGEIEGVLGITSVVPLEDTVSAVLKLKQALETEQRAHAETRHAMGAAQMAMQWLKAELDRARPVLEACAAMQLGDDDPDADPLEPQEVGEDCYIYTDDQCAIVRAELARRAAARGTEGKP